jgi:hypothetical protein
MQGFLARKTFKNYRELLAEERSETERLFILKVLASKQANKRRLSGRGWMVADGQRGTDG